MNIESGCTSSPMSGRPISSNSTQGLTNSTNNGHFNDIVETSGKDIHISKVFVDKLSLTYKLTTEGINYVITQLGELIDEGMAVEKYSARYMYSVIIGEKENSGYINPAQAGTLRIDAGAKSGNVADFRIEFNPSKANLNVVGQVLNTVLKRGVCEIWNYGRITRMDLAVDVFPLKQSDIIVTVDRLQVSSMHNGRDGATETLYWGCNKDIVVYDKCRETSAKKTKLYSAPKSQPMPGTLRFEVRYKPGSELALAQLNHVPNPFNRIVVCTWPNVNGDGLNWPPCFLDSVRYRGFTAAKQNLDEAGRKLVMRRLNNCHAEFWKPEKIWAGGSSVIQTLGGLLECKSKLL